MAGKSLKTYWSIKETSEIVGVAASTLRYWETQFRELHPKKTSTGARQYTEKDIELLKLIAHLTKDKGLSMKAAEERLRSSRDTVVETAEIVERLKAVRNELQTMLDQMR